MIKSYLLITLRGMTKNKLFVFINVFGLGIAIACCIVAYLAHQYDARFDNVHENSASIYRVSAVREFDNTTTRFGYAPLPLGEIIDKTFTEVDKSSRYLYASSDFKRGDDLFPANLSYVDHEFFQMFSWKFVFGNPSALKDNGSVVISERMAIRLFGDAQSAFGKMITRVHGIEKKEVVVAAVIKDPPANSSFHKSDGSAYMNFENYKDENRDIREDDWRNESTLFVQITDPARVNQVYQQLQAFKENNNSIREDFQVKDFALDPFLTMAHRDREDGVRASTWAAPPLSAIIGTAVMAILLLLIACFNLTNTAIAISSRRLKEIGIRKVMGSMRIQLIFQFIGETTFICFLALLIGISFTDFLIQGWNITTENNIHLDATYFDDIAFLLFLVGVLAATGLIAGSYPAFYISKFKPVTILKGKLKFGGTNYFSRILLGLQFAFSLIAIVNAIGFFQNARYQNAYDLGFDIRGSIVAPVNNQNEFDTYRNSLQTNSEIHSVAGAASTIFSGRKHEPVAHESREVEVDIIAVGDHYLQTTGMNLVSGRDFIKDSEADASESVIITEKMADVFAWDQPLGKQILWKDSVKLFVVGVVKDVYARGLWEEIEPMMIRYVMPHEYRQIVVNTNSERVARVNAYMEEAWTEIFPGRLYTGSMLVSQLHQVVDLNFSIMYVYAFLGAIALLLSATGLYTLVSLNIIKRMKEIGVRKILGASVANISRIVNTEFIIILAIASVLGTWSSYNMSNLIMSSIWKYYQGVNAITFISAIGILFTVSFFAIGYKVITVAMLNPVKTLRDE